MAEQAKILSTDALEAFRGALVIFTAKTRRSLDDASDQIRQTRSWLQNDQRIYCEGEIRRNTKTLEQAENELRNAQFGGKSEAAMVVYRSKIRKAKQDVEEFRNKLQVVKKWNQVYDNRSDPMAKRMEALRQVLEVDMPKAMNFLTQAQDTLEQYLQMSVPDQGPTSSS
jgi:chromosome segregation ATPase